MRQRLALWGALATVAVVAVTLVVVARSGDDGDLPQLPLAAGGDGQADRAVAESMALAAVTYVPSDDLPALGGDGPSYRLGGSPDADAVQDLAEALGVDAEPTEANGSWHAETDEYVLDVYGPEGAWSLAWVAYTDEAAPPTEVVEPETAEASPTTFPPTTVPSTTTRPAFPECMEPPPGYPDADAAVDESALLSLDCEQATVEPSDPDTGEPVPVEPVLPPADLPEEAEARSIALDLLARTGLDVEDAEVTVADAFAEWFVSVEPRLEGRPAPGLTSSVAIGGGGRVTSASGFLARPEHLGDYPLIDTRAALDRLNTGWWGGVSTLELDQPATTGADRQGSRPGAPANGAGSVSTVVVTDAEVVLVSVPSWDASGTYLVPGYRFSAEDGSAPTVPAVGDDVLAPPPASDVGPSTTVGELVPPTTEPGPAPGPTTHPGPTVVDPAPSDGETIDVALYHCGFEEVHKDGRRWVVVSPPFDATDAPPEFVGRGTFVVQAEGRTAVYTDGSGIVLEFMQVNEAWEFPPCA